MNVRLIYLPFFLLLFFACNDRKKQEGYEKKELEFNQREQQLLSREKSIELREQELLKREAEFDSSLKKDTAAHTHPLLAGRWSVSMSCIEASCQGSAVGDKKTEQWDVTYVGNNIRVRATDANKFVHGYTGSFTTANTIELVRDNSTNNNSLLERGTKMSVRLRLAADESIDGEREIVRDNGCKVVYALQLVKE